MHFGRLRSLAPLACVVALGFTASADLRTIEGGCAPLYDGKVCTWATTSGDEVVAFGVTVPIQTIEDAPLGLEPVFPPVPVAVIPLPAEVSKATGFNHLMVNWESHGHPPALFAVPHFDFHFYTVDPAAVTAMDCSDLSKPAELPAGYALPDIAIPGMGELVGLCVPGMGMHAMPANEVNETKPFGASMLVGYYKGGAIFLEPMIARTKLLKEQGFTMQVPRATATTANVRWPSRFEAVYDGPTQAYRFTFSGFETDR
ncbi:MAG: hypothetical protein PVI01_09760 [Gemmatimonadales bacterium]|jgi:hypothetical protein